MAASLVVWGRRRWESTTFFPSAFFGRLRVSLSFAFFAFSLPSRCGMALFCFFLLPLLRLFPFPSLFSAVPIQRCASPSLLRSGRLKKALSSLFPAPKLSTVIRHSFAFSLPSLFHLGVSLSPPSRLQGCSWLLLQHRVAKTGDGREAINFLSCLGEHLAIIKQFIFFLYRNHPVAKKGNTGRIFLLLLPCHRAVYFLPLHFLSGALEMKRERVRAMEENSNDRGSLHTLLWWKGGLRAFFSLSSLPFFPQPPRLV